jgi:hypothetical protein
MVWYIVVEFELQNPESIPEPEVLVPRCEAKAILGYGEDYKISMCYTKAC